MILAKCVFKWLQPLLNAIVFNWTKDYDAGWQIQNARSHTFHSFDNKKKRKKFKWRFGDLDEHWAFQLQTKYELQ